MIILLPMDLILKALTGQGVRVSEEVEDAGLDISEHGESMVAPHSGSVFDAEKGAVNQVVAISADAPP